MRSSHQRSRPCHRSKRRVREKIGRNETSRTCNNSTTFPSITRGIGSVIVLPVVILLVRLTTRRSSGSCLLSACSYASDLFLEKFFDHGEIYCMAGLV